MATQSATPPEKPFRYTSLPAEIRNLIMEYALIPGDVYPCPTINNKGQAKSFSANELLRSVLKFQSTSSSSSHFKINLAGVHPRLVSPPSPSTPPTKPHHHQPAFQLLITCRQTYTDGHHMFYTSNTFHLPPGSAADAQFWSSTLRPTTRSLIRSLALAFSLADLTPPVLAEMESKWLWDLPLKTQRLKRRMVFEVTYALCWRYWRDKLDWVKKWQGVERVVLAFDSGGEEEEGRVELGVMLMEEGAGWEEKEERRVLERAREAVRGVLERLVDEVGWKAARKALMG